MEPEEVVAVVQENAASEAAGEAAAAAAAGDAVISGQVAEVSDDLADHAEVSEERHEEILEGEAWLRSQLETIAAQQSAMQAQLTAIQSSNQSQLDLMNQRLEAMSRQEQQNPSQPLSPASSQST